MSAARIEPAPVLRGRLGQVIRDYGADSPRAKTLRRQLAAAKINQAIDAALAAAGGPLLPDDAEYLAARVKDAAQ